MTYGKLKERVMQLIFSYSVAGSEIPESYNNQADYLAMIPSLVNDAQMDVATTVRRLPAIAELSSLEHYTLCGKELYTLPDDCWNLMTGGLLYRDSPLYDRFFGYRLIAGGRILEMPAHMGDEFAVEYWRYPTVVDDVTDDDEELDNTPEVHECIVYYVASYLLLYDDPYRAEIFKKQYTERLARLKEPVWLEPQPIQNVYQT